MIFSAGIIIFALWIVTSRQFFSLSQGVIEAPWPIHESYAVMVRSAFWAFVILAGSIYLEKKGLPHFFFLWGTLFASSPCFGLFSVIF